MTILATRRFPRRPRRKRVVQRVLTFRWLQEALDLQPDDTEFHVRTSLLCPLAGAVRKGRPPSCTAWRLAELDLPTAWSSNRTNATALRVFSGARKVFL